MCSCGNAGETTLSAGAVGNVMQDTGFKDVAFSFPLPASYLGVNDGSSISKYMNSTRNATTTTLKSNVVKDTLAPYVVSFPSRGPNPITSDILKPDLTAPAVVILAAWSLVSPVSGVKGDNRRVPFNILSGTSMACPHATGVAAYIKSFHPSWSPAAIKSALMTTAFPLSVKTNSTDAEIAYGAGHLDPIKAVNPGLVDDADAADYVRTLTNVGSAGCTYNSRIIAPRELHIQVEPTILSFTSLGQKLSFVVKVEGKIGKTIAFASLVWDDGIHQVRSRIVVYALS
ncbi:hypothetical protein F0562_031652 [Nyssa sinensis]|uniref:Peptidase S8/S53 domain-containing protein n=1 Tax=Nyssa sinensis TaxID=561372 RepID=A0A5J5ASS8_9ASTE|nr:hypothetical protein F0562_031652 [Nyssa sinensis]